MSRLVLALALCWACTSVALAQGLPSGPLRFADGRAVVGLDVALTMGSDDTGYFNYADYDRSLLRLAQVDLTGEATLNDHVSLLLDGRLLNSDVTAAGVYVRLRPWANRGFTIQAGRIPPTFGAYGRRAYGVENPLVGLPVGYQYLTSLRPDSLPSNTDDLLRMRGRGWLSSFPLGETYAEHGSPLVAGTRWDTGVQAHLDTATVDTTVGVTLGSLANPLVRDDNDRPQVSARLAWHPNAAVTLGVSAARGAFVTRDAARATGAADAGAFTQRAWGADAELSRDHVLVRAEVIVSDWQMPQVTDAPLRAWSTSLEGRYKLAPGAYVAARLDHLAFSELTGSTGRQTWDANLTRVEVGAGYSLQRNLVAKLVYQRNTRDGGRVPSLGLVAAQLRFWL